ncbi:MAG: 50S ribosomal protein L5 [Planctomycetaceae bacterium]|nr:50S ribosomal protein L5 [Planctomycetaceae bacterium]
MARLQEQYRSEIVPRLAEQLGRQNVLSLPRLEKIVVSMGLGNAMQDRKLLEENMQHMANFTGQKAQVTRARKSIAGFKLREGMEIGCRVTLRGKRMFEFFDRLVSIALPRVRDFRGLNPKAFDGHGNYNMGLTEQTVFPEINPDRVKVIHGMNITFVTTAKTNEEGLVLLKEFGMPFRTE